MLLVAKVREKMLRQRKFKTVVRLSLSFSEEREGNRKKRDRARFKKLGKKFTKKKFARYL